MSDRKHVPPFVEIIGRDDDGHSLYIGEFYLDGYVSCRDGCVCVRQRTIDGCDEILAIIETAASSDDVLS